MKDPTDRLRELEGQCEAPQQALIEIRAAIWEPKTTLPQIRRRIEQILHHIHNRAKFLTDRASPSQFVLMAPYF